MHMNVYVCVSLPVRNKCLVVFISLSFIFSLNAHAYLWMCVYSVSECVYVCVWSMQVYARVFMLILPRVWPRCVWDAAIIDI